MGSLSLKKGNETLSIVAETITGEQVMEFMGIELLKK